MVHRLKLFGRVALSTSRPDILDALHQVLLGTAGGLRTPLD
jgi:hypothetical protein